MRKIWILLALGFFVEPLWGQTIPVILDSSLLSVELSGVIKQSNGIITGGVTGISTPYHEEAYGILASLKTSAVLTYFNPQIDSKFRFGDRILGRIGSGLETSNRSENHVQIWGTYRFEIGLMSEFIQNSKRIYRLAYSPLVFEKDQISPSISGSSLGLEVTFSPIELSINVLSRTDKYIGFLSSITQPHSHATNFEGSLGYTLYRRKLIKLQYLQFHAPENTYINKTLDQKIKSQYSLFITYAIIF